MKIDFRKHYTKHFDALMQAAGPVVFGASGGGLVNESGQGHSVNNSVVSGSSTTSNSGGNANQNATSGIILNEHGNSSTASQQSLSEQNIVPPQPSLTIYSHPNGCITMESEPNDPIHQVHGGNKFLYPNQKENNQDNPSLQYSFSIFSGKSFVQSVEWPIVKVLRFKLSVPCIVDFLDYFDTHCQIRSRKSSAIDIILYHPELLYGNKTTTVALAVWFLSHKNQEHVHAILQKMQSFECFTTSKQLAESKTMNENSITTADLRRLVTQLRDAFKAYNAGQQQGVSLQQIPNQVPQLPHTHQQIPNQLPQLSQLSHQHQHQHQQNLPNQVQVPQQVGGPGTMPNQCVAIQANNVQNQNPGGPPPPLVPGSQQSHHAQATNWVTANQQQQQQNLVVNGAQLSGPGGPHGPVGPHNSNQCGVNLGPGPSSNPNQMQYGVGSNNPGLPQVVNHNHVNVGPGQVVANAGQQIGPNGPVVQSQVQHGPGGPDNSSAQGNVMNSKVVDKDVLMGTNSQDNSRWEQHQHRNYPDYHHTQAMAPHGIMISLS